jgi:PPOX class probable F420-dependent enzyme
LTTLPDSHRDLLSARGVAVLTTNGADGLPQSTAIWYLLDGEVVRISLHTSRQKYRNLRRDPHATLFLLDPTNPYRTLEIRGDVTLEDDRDRSFIERVLHHYGQDPSTFPAPLDDRVIVTLVPRRVVTNG